MKLDDGRGISRRTIARGAAWSVPVALVATAAPAFAGSAQQCLTAEWTEAVYSGAGGKWQFCYAFYSCGTADITVNQIDVHTTYAAPASNQAPAQLVQTMKPNIKVPVASRPGNAFEWCAAGRTAFGSNNVGEPPEDAAGKTLLPSYYNDYSGDGKPDDDTSSKDTGKILCVSKDTNTSPVYPTDATYPPSCRRLLNESTYAVVTFTSNGVTDTLVVPFTAEVGCRVVAGCLDKPST